MLTGIMRDGVILCGTGLVLVKGQEVRLLEATNLPKREDGRMQWFAAPVDGGWENDSILIEDGDVDVEAPNLDCELDTAELARYVRDGSNPDSLRHYAACKVLAMDARLAGKMGDALHWERLCEEDYRKLPAVYRW